MEQQQQNPMAIQSNGAPAQAEDAPKSGASAFNPGSTDFNFNATEFVPAGQLVNTKEQFPDLMDAMKEGKGGKKKKGNKAAVDLGAQKDQDADSTPWKGKPSAFFVMKKNDGPSTD